MSRLEGVFREVVAHPVAVGMLFLAAVVFGWVSYQRLPVELMPDISYPTITVRTTFDGAAPEEVESQISRQIEARLATLDGLVTLESRSRAGSSDVVLGFDWGTDMSEASQSIREGLQKVFLPQGTDRPLILRYDPSMDPFLRIALAVDADDPGELTRGPEALFLLREVAERDLKRELEGLPGVAAVQVRGGLEREIRIDVREDWLAARRVTLQQVKNALAAQNVNLAGGSIIEGDTEYLVRTLNELRAADDIAALRIQRGDGTLVPLSDLAVVHETHREREVITRLDGEEAVELEVYKEADANVVTVADLVKHRLLGDGSPELPRDHPLAQFYDRPLVKDLPVGLVVEVLDDQASFIEAAVSNLASTAVLGGLLAVCVLFLFLRDFRATGIIGLAIPVSITAGFGPLYVGGVTLNLMSLGGLALGVGMLVDNAVVVLESIQRYRDAGDDRVTAAVRGTADVAAAVSASTLTTVAVFAPIAFVEGVAGELFGDLSIAVVASLLASLVVALFLVPTLAALSLEGVGVGEEGVIGELATFRRGPMAPGAIPRLGRALLDFWVGPPLRRIQAFTARAQQRPATALLAPWEMSMAGVQFVLRTVGFGVLASVATIGLLASFPLRLGSWVARVVLAGAFGGAFQWGYGRFERGFATFLPKALRRPGLVLGLAAVVTVGAIAGATRLGTELIPEVHQGRFVAELAMPVGTPLRTTSRVVQVAERLARQHPDVRAVYATIGVDRRLDARSDEGQHTARLRVEMTPGGDLAQREDRVMEELRAQLAELPRTEVRMVRPALFSFRTPVEVAVYGWDLAGLRRSGDEVVAALEGLPGLRDVQSSLVRGHPELQITYDRQRLHHFGLDPAMVASQVRDAVQGATATEIHRADERIDLRVQLDEAERSDLDDLAALNVNPTLFPPIRLDQVADLVEGEGPSEIRRVDQQRAVVVSANIAGFDLGTAADEITTAVAGADLPPGTVWEVGGQSAEMQGSLASLRFALLLAVFLVYVIMASTFEHLLHPFVILFTVPLAAVGVALTLLVTGLPISVVVLIGVIVLAGVVVNNAIVLVDTVNRLRRRGRDTLTALQEAGTLRLRPILITTTTTVLGLLPLAAGLGEGAEIQQPLAITVIGGLISSTVLTLVVIPVAYQLITPRGAAAAEDVPEGEVAR